MPALTHGRVKNGFNGHATSTPGARILSYKNNQPRYSMKHIRTAAAVNSDVQRKTALVGGIGTNNAFVKRAYQRRVVKQTKDANGNIVKDNNCCD
tara:strand:+ start:871 stop:1155 length:285 start_codon:yes stop_codon:yes gene_type:complete